MDYLNRKAEDQRSVPNWQIIFLVVTTLLFTQFRPAFADSGLETATVKPVTLSREFRLDGTV